MSKNLIVKICPDGKIEAKVEGFKGNECCQYINILEELLEAEIVDSAYTQEFYNTTTVHEVAMQEVKNNDC